MALVKAKIDKETAMAALIRVVSYAVIYGKNFEFDYKNNELTIAYDKEEE